MSAVQIRSHVWAVAHGAQHAAEELYGAHAARVIRRMVLVLLSLEDDDLESARARLRLSVIELLLVAWRADRHARGLP